MTSSDRLREFLAVVAALTLIAAIVAAAVGAGLAAYFWISPEWGYPIGFFPVLIVGAAAAAVFLFPLMTWIRGW